MIFTVQNGPDPQKNCSYKKKNNRNFVDSRCFSMKNQLFPLKSPLAYTRILKGTPKMVFGHNLRYMAPFDFSSAGFCMFFRRASFVVLCTGTDFGGRGRILEPQGRHFGPWTLLVPKMVPKKVVLWRNDFVVGFWRNPSCPSEFYGP